MQARLHIFSNESAKEPCLEASPNPDETLQYVYPLRVILVGETLFLLRSCDGFEEMCRRLKEQNDFRSAFYELRAAKRMFQRGFDIHMRPETKIKGEDFDFTASRGSMEINVEVTALKEKEFYHQTALNALNTKRDQLAKDKPAIIFCMLPRQWESSNVNLNEYTDNLAAEFLRGTQRINVIVFEIERRINASANQASGGMYVISKPIFNKNPRHSADLGFFFEGWPSVSDRITLDDSIRNMRNVPELEKRARTSEFYRWVDYLAPE